MSDTERVDGLARVLIAEWERVEGPVTASYVANFADMARAVIASDWLAANNAQVRAETLREGQEAITGLLHPEFGTIWREGDGEAWLAIQQAVAEERERIAAAIEDRKNAYGMLSEYTEGLRDGLFIAQGIARAEPTDSEVE